MANNKFKHPFRELADDFKRLKNQLPNKVSTIAVREFKENFRRQGYINKGGVLIPWKKTKKKRNTFGVKSKGILIGSGRLKRGYRKAPLPGMARVVNDVPYAQAHETGIKKTVKVKAHTRRVFGYEKIGTGKFTKSGKERQKTVRTATGKIKVKAHSRKMNLDKRPVMVTGKAFWDQVDKMLDHDIDKIF